MPRKTKSETTAAKSAKQKTIKEKKATTNTKGAVALKLETPKYSEVILNYRRNGNLGFSTVHETVNISFLLKKKFTSRITALFHFIRQTEVCKDFGSGRTATFQIDNKPVLSLTQKAGDYDKQIFTLTRYREDGSKQSTRKCNYNKTKNLILQAFGFKVKTDEDTDEKLEESEEIEDGEMLGIENDIDYEFGDME